MNEIDSQRSVLELKQKHLGEDIWVIAAGPSMNFVEPDFFRNKVTIGVNRVNRKFDCDYIVAKDAAGFAELLEHQKRAKLIFSRYESGDPERKENFIDQEHWIFDHPAKPNEEPDLSVIGSEKIVVSYSTITSAIHLAAYMGAANILVCGHDCGAIDGESTLVDYYSAVERFHKTDVGYFRWLGKIESHTRRVADSLIDVYGVAVHSLNPFLNLNLDGHKFESSTHMQQLGNLTVEALREEVEFATRKALSFERVALDKSNSLSFRIGSAVTYPIREIRERLNALRQNRRPNKS